MFAGESCTRHPVTDLKFQNVYSMGRNLKHILRYRSTAKRDIEQGGSLIKCEVTGQVHYFVGDNWLQVRYK